jgi:hypothetical protein
VTQVLDPIETQIVAILESARGQTGLGADAALRYFPAGRWRRSTYAGPLTDPMYPPAAFDRSYEIAWQDFGQDPDPQNPLDPTQLMSVGCALNVGFSYGKEIPQFINTTGTEVAVTASTFPRKRALSEMDRALRALTFPAIFADTNLSGSGISWIECVRDGLVILSDNGFGRMVATARLSILIEVPTATSFDP